MLLCASFNPLPVSAALRAALDAIIAAVRPVPANDGRPWRAEQLADIVAQLRAVAINADVPMALHAAEVLGLPWDDRTIDAAHVVWAREVLEHGGQVASETAIAVSAGF